MCSGTPYLAALIMLVLASLCASQTILQVQHGWGGKDRAGRWNPVTVRVSDRVPRNVSMELIAPTEGGFANVIGEQVAIGPTPATFELFAPTQYSRFGQSVLVLRDSQTRKLVAQFPPHLRQRAPAVAQLGAQGIFIGVSGDRVLIDPLVRYFGAQTAHMPTRFLPRAPIGYDCLEVLYLNQPDLTVADADQQRALLAWVRGGGSLLFVPGTDPLPRDSPLLAALPCTLGPAAQVTLSPDVLAASGLLPRYAVMAGRTLSPAPGARSLELLSGAHVTAWTGQYGFGRILVSPIDLGHLEFNELDEPRKARAFWQPVLDALVTTPRPSERQTFSAPYNGYQSESEDQQREGAAMSTLADFVAPERVWGGLRLPGGVFAVLGILFIIGPVDWLVLRLLGSRPWTWITTGGWIGLIALGVLCLFSAAGHAPPELNTVRIIDQADDASVCTTDLLGIQSSASEAYPLDAGGEPGGWWEPVLPGTPAAASPAAQPDTAFHETDRDCLPEPLWIQAQGKRFLRARASMSGPPVIQASLRLSGSSPRLIGSIKNVSAQPLKDLRIRTRWGVVRPPLGTSQILHSQEQVSIDLPAAGDPFAPGGLESRYQSYGAFGSRSYGTPVREEDLWSAAPDLAGRRSLRIDSLVDGADGFACIYAQFVDPPPIIRLSSAAPSRGNPYQWLRALVPLLHQPASGDAMIQAAPTAPNLQQPSTK